MSQWLMQVYIYTISHFEKYLSEDMDKIGLLLDNNANALRSFISGD